jgi:hypothetical protein
MRNVLLYICLVGVGIAISPGITASSGKPGRQDGRLVVGPGIALWGNYLRDFTFTLRADQAVLVLVPLVIALMAVDHFARAGRVQMLMAVR